MRKSSVSVLTAIVVAGILTGCSAPENKATSTNTATASDTTANGDKKPPQVTTTVQPNGQKQIKISLESLPNDMEICKIESTPITIGDYRRMLKLQEIQAQQNISNDANLSAKLYQEATKRGISLTAEEKAKLIESAKAQHPDFQAFLKEKNLTEDQFNKQVEQAGVVFKLSNAAIEEQLLSQVVSRALLVRAAQGASNRQSADATYNKLKAQTNNFEQLKKATGLTDDEIKTETVQAELARMQLAKIEQGIKISDKEIDNWYKANKSQLKHNERIRIARIVVSAPEQTGGNLVSVKDQVKKANPKLEGAELDKMVANVMTAQQQKALVLLGEAKATKDFVKLANDNSDDGITKALKNGGDMGWQEKSQLVPQFADAVWTVKAGDVLPKLVKTNEGFSIIKVTGHQGSGTMDLSEVKNAITMKLKQEKLNKELNNWIAAQQKTVKITFAPKFLQIASGGQQPASKVQ